MIRVATESIIIIGISAKNSALGGKQAEILNLFISFRRSKYVDGMKRVGMAFVVALSVIMLMGSTAFSSSNSINIRINASINTSGLNGILSGISSSIGNLFKSLNSSKGTISSVSNSLEGEIGKVNVSNTISTSSNELAKAQKSANASLPVIGSIFSELGTFVSKLGSLLSGMASATSNAAAASSGR